jgi:hypothetical protein
MANGKTNTTDPLDMPLPCEIRVPGMRFSKGVKLRVFVEAAARWKAMADRPTQKMNTQEVARFLERLHRKENLRGEN